MSDERPTEQPAKAEASETAPESDAAPGSETTPRRPPSSGGRTAGIIASSILGVFGLVVLLGGLALIAIHAFVRDDDGFYFTNDEELHSSGFALATDEVDLGGVGGFGADDLSASVRIDASSANGRPLFIGIGPTTEVERYLDGVAHTEVVDFGDGGPEYVQHPGGAPPGPPGAQAFWVASSQGVDQQRVEWDLESGTYTAVAMNAGTARGVDVDVDVGAKVSWLIWVGVGLTVVGLLIVGSVVFLISRLSRRPEAV